MKKKRKKNPITEEVPVTDDQPTPIEPRKDPFSRFPLKAAVLGVLISFVLLTRFYSLESQGFHHDESIHCLHSWQVANKGPQTYRYNPVYHGPFLYHWGGLFHYFSQLEPPGEKPESYRFYHHLLPDEDWVGRLPYAVMGVFLILVFLPLGKHLGWGTVFLIIAFLTLSPVIDYFSRFARNDVYQTAWLSGSIVCGFLYFQSKKVRYLTLVVLFMTLCYCTKENSYMNNFVLCSFVILWGVVEWVRSPKATLERMTQDYAPLVRLLILFGWFSVFVFLFVAIDSRVSPETGIWTGVKNILSHSTALTEKIDASALKQETGYFTSAGREETRSSYYRLAFGATAFFLLAFEFLVFFIRKRTHSEQPLFTHLLRLGLSILFIAILMWSAVKFSTWAPSAERAGFLNALFTRAGVQVIGFGFLATLFSVPGRLAKREGNGFFRETFDWWNLAIQVVLAQTIYLFLFTSMGTNIKRGSSAGMYDYISYWFKHQTGDFRIWGAWWYYLPRLFLYELLPLVLIFVVGAILFVQFGKRVLLKSRTEELKARAHDSVEKSVEASNYWKPIPFPLMAFAVYQLVFMLGIYAILNEKVPWLLTYQSFALNFLAALLLARYFTKHPNTPGPFVGFFWDLFSPRNRISRWVFISRILACGLLVLLIPFAVGQHLAAVFVRPDNHTEMLLYTGTTYQFADHIERIRGMREKARESGQKLKIAVDGKSEWPSAWYFRNDPVRWKAVDLSQDIQILDNTSPNLRRMKPGRGKVWEIDECDLRGWWIWHGTPKALPGELNLTANVKAFLANTSNDKRQYFPRDQRPDGKDYVVGFREQVLRYVFGRRIWYPTGGEKILVCYKTDEDVPIEESESYLEGVLDRETNLSSMRSSGSSGDSAGTFNQPRGLATTPEGMLVVADSKNARILVLDKEGKVTQTIGEGILKPDVTGPCGVDCDSDGNFYVTDTWDHSIKKFSKEGTLVGTFKGQSSGRVRTNLYGPRGIAVSAEGKVYVSDTGNHCIRVFDKDLQYLKTWGGAGDQISQFREPVGIAVDAQNQVYIADTGNGRIQKFSADGDFLAEFQTLAPLDHEVSGVEPNLEFLPDGRLVLSCSNEGTIWVIDIDRKLVKRFAVARPKLRSPLGLTSLPDGRLWISGRDTNVVCEVKIP